MMGPMIRPSGAGVRAWLGAVCLLASVGLLGAAAAAQAQVRVSGRTMSDTSAPVAAADGRRADAGLGCRGGAGHERCLGRVRARDCRHRRLPGQRRAPGLLRDRASGDDARARHGRRADALPGARAPRVARRHLARRSGQHQPAVGRAGAQRRRGDERAVQRIARRQERAAHAAQRGHGRRRRHPRRRRPREPDALHPRRLQRRRSAERRLRSAGQRRGGPGADGAQRRLRGRVRQGQRRRHRGGDARRRRSPALLRHRLLPDHRAREGAAHPGLDAAPVDVRPAGARPGVVLGQLHRRVRPVLRRGAAGGPGLQQQQAPQQPPAGPDQPDREERAPRRRRRQRRPRPAPRPGPARSGVDDPRREIAPMVRERPRSARLRQRRGPRSRLRRQPDGAAADAEAGTRPSSARRKGGAATTTTTAARTRSAIRSSPTSTRRR